MTCFLFGFGLLQYRRDRTNKTLVCRPWFHYQNLVNNIKTHLVRLLLKSCYIVLGKLSSNCWACMLEMHQVLCLKNASPFYSLQFLQLSFYNGLHLPPAIQIVVLLEQCCNLYKRTQ